MITAVLALLPWGAASVIAHATTNAPYYSEGLHSFAKPVQERTSFASKDFKITNPNFADGNITDFLSKSIAGWESSNAPNTVMGVVNTNRFDTFKGNQELAKLDFMKTNPSSSDPASPNVLVIANKAEMVTSSAGFTQNLGEFWANGYFEVKVDFYSIGGESAIYLIPDKPFTDGRTLPQVKVEQASIAPDGNNVIPNVSVWRTATFLVKTSLLESVNFKLGLYLGKHGGGVAGGVVYYDNVRVRGYSAAQFEQTFNKVANEKPSRTCVVDLSKPISPYPNPITPLETPVFENFDNPNTVKFKVMQSFATPDNTKIAPSISLANVSAALNIKEANVEVFGVTAPNNSRAMLLSAVNTSVGLQYTETLKWNRNDIYMINFYALSGSSGFFRIRDVRDGKLNNPAHETIYNSGFLPVKTNTTTASPSQNNWVLNSVFVIGEPLADIETYFEFWVGGESNTTGYLLVDNFSVSRISADFFESYKDDSNATTCNLDYLTATPTISNSNFNKGVKRNNVAAFPLVADDWSVSLEGEPLTDHSAEHKIINGIVNTDGDHWLENNIKLPNEHRHAYGYANPLPEPIEIGKYAQPLNNNIYMMQNFSPTYQTVASNSFTLASSTRNVISFYMAAQNISSSEVWAILEIGGREATRLQLPRTTNKPVWQNYSIAVLTSKFTSPEARITFALGSKNSPSTGCLFLDRVMVDQASNETSDITVDLNDPSKLYLHEANTTKTRLESLFFAPEDSKTASAVFDTKHDILSVTTHGASHAKVSTILTEQLAAETAYEYIIKLCHNPKPDVELALLPDPDPDKETPDYGISFRIKGMEGGFINLKREDFQKKMPVTTIPNTDEHVIELRFLIKSGTALDLALEIEFGNKDAHVVGSVGIKGIELNELDDESFKSAEEANNTRIITTSIVDQEGDETEKGPGTSLDFLIVPSLITGAAVIFAVVGTIIRRTKFKFHIKQQHTSYARDDFETKIPKKDLKTPKAKKAPKKGMPVKEKK